MVLPNQISTRDSLRFGRVALTALVIGLGVAAVSSLPLADMAYAEKGGNGGGNGGGHGGGNGGGQGHSGDHGGGNGNGGGNAGGNSGSNAGGNGNGNANGHDGPGNSANAGKRDDGGVDQSPDDDTDTASSDDSTTDDGSMKANKLGKLNGFFHASPNALANASPNSSIGRISQTFRDALSDFAEANQDETDDGTAGEATPPTGPSVEDLGAILAGATNKPVTGAQVQAIIDRLAEQNPDDDAINDLADSEDEATAQDIADAANAAKAGETTDDSNDDATDGDTSDTSGDSSRDTTDDTVTTTATN
jgi:hypothetical protein